MNTIYYINLIKTYDTELQEGSLWQHYSLTDSNNNITFKGYLLLSSSLSEEETKQAIRKEISENGGGYENFFKTHPKLSQLNDFLSECIKDCLQSDNEMIFIECDDYRLELININEVVESIESNFFEETIEYDIEDFKELANSGEPVFTFYGGVIEKINWID